jgi:hypothetical protein
VITRIRIRPGSAEDRNIDRLTDNTLEFAAKCRGLSGLPRNPAADFPPKGTAMTSSPEISYGQWADLSRRRLLASFAAGTAATLLPGAVFAAGTPRRGGVLKVSSANNPSSLDPMTGRSGFDHPMLYPLFDTLVEFDYATLTPKPGIAKSWSLKDPTTLVMELNDGVTFHDGTKCDAAAVKFNLERSMTD